MRAKYLEVRERTDGVVFVINPPKYMKAIVGAEHRIFKVRDEAVRYSDEICAAYYDYKARNGAGIHINEDTVEGVIAHYRTTQAWKVLADNSKLHYDLMFRTSCGIRIGHSNVLFGHMLARNVTPELADKFYSTVRVLKGHHRANACVKAMRRAFNIAVRHSRLQRNPFLQMGLEGLQPRVVLWEPEDVEKFVKTADEMGRPSIGTIALLCYHLCQRPGDMRQLRWENYDGRVFRFKQEKTKVDVEIPATPLLIERLSKIERTGDSPFILRDEETQKPYDRYRYYKLANMVREQSGLPEHLQLRDLRRTGATELAENGCTEDELRSITGHTSRNILNTYVRPTRKMAQSAMLKRFG